MDTSRFHITLVGEKVCGAQAKRNTPDENSKCRSSGILTQLLLFSFKMLLVTYAGYPHLSAPHIIFWSTLLPQSSDHTLYASYAGASDPDAMPHPNPPLHQAKNSAAHVIYESRPIRQVKKLTALRYRCFPCPCSHYKWKIVEKKTIKGVDFVGRRIILIFLFFPL